MSEPKGTSLTYRAFPDAIDELKQALLDVEDSLSTMLDKVSAEIELESSEEELDNGDTLSWSRQLVFHKVGKAWRLDCYEWHDHMEPGDETMTRLVDAPLQARILAARRLPHLLERIRELRDRKIEEVRSATEAARAFAVRVVEEEAIRE